MEIIGRVGAVISDVASKEVAIKKTVITHRKEREKREYLKSSTYQKIMPPGKKFEPQ